MSINENDYNEIAPYRKKKTKKSPKKVDHKHNYIPFIGRYPLRDSYSYVIAEECSICKKQRITKYFITVPLPNSRLNRVVFDLPSIQKIYPDYEVKDIINRYS